jgi:hypothetical protein
MTKIMGERESEWVARRESLNFGIIRVYAFALRVCQYTTINFTIKESERERERESTNDKKEDGITQHRKIV